MTMDWATYTPTPYRTNAGWYIPGYGPSPTPTIPGAPTPSASLQTPLQSPGSPVPGQGSEYPFTDLLNEDPRLGYQSYLPQFNLSQNQKKFFQNNYQDIFNEYLGALGQQIRQGQSPNLKFTDYLSQTPFTERYSSLSPEQRGETQQGRFSPRTRWFI